MCFPMSPTLRRIVREIARVLAPGGLFAFTVETHARRRRRAAADLALRPRRRLCAGGDRRAGLRLLSSRRPRRAPRRARRSRGSWWWRANRSRPRQPRTLPLAGKSGRRTMRTSLLPPAFAVALALLLPCPVFAQQGKPEIPKLRLAVGGKSADLLSAAVGDRAARLFQGGRPRGRDRRRAERRPRAAVAGGRQRRGRRRHLRPHHPDAGQEPAGGGGRAIRPLSGLRAEHHRVEADRLSAARKSLKGSQDRRHVARLQHPFHGGLYAGAQRAQGSTTPRSSAPA